MLEGLGDIGYDALNLGGADLLLEPALLARLRAESRVSLLSANAVDAAGKNPFPGWIVKKFGEVRVGIFGITGNQLSPPQAAAGRLGVSEPLAAARRAVAELRDTCQVVIALSQLGLEADARLAREVPGIDVILGGFNHTQTPAPRLEGGTLIVHSGAKGMRIGRLDIEVDPARTGPWTPRRTARGGEARLFDWSLVPLDASLPDDPGLAALLERYRSQLRERHLAEQATAPPPPPAAPAPAGPPYVGSAACGRCHPVQLREWEASRHARAFAALERKHQDLNPECVRCHVTAFGEPGGYRPEVQGPASLANVQCEACHGFGREHRGRGKIRGRVGETVCRRCHSTENSPTFKYEPYLRKLGPHAARYFTRPDAATSTVTPQAR